MAARIRASRKRRSKSGGPRASRPPRPEVALDQLQYAVPWFDTYNTVAVRKAMEDQVQAIPLRQNNPGRRRPDRQKNADELLRPYVEETALKRLA